jgi:hypothetical protein
MRCGPLQAFFSSGHGMASLEGQALDIGFKAGPVQYEDMEAGSVDLAVRVHGGRLILIA